MTTTKKRIWSFQIKKNEENTWRKVCASNLKVAMDYLGEDASYVVYVSSEEYEVIDE